MAMVSAFTTDAGANSYGREIALQSKLGISGSSQYISPDDNVWVMTSCGQGGGTATVDARLLMPSGEVKPWQFSFVVPNQRIAFNTVIPLPECFILSIAVRSTAVCDFGQLYVTLYIARYQNTGVFLPCLLARGYLSQFCGLGWPNAPQRGTQEGRGFLRTITGTAPGAGVEINETVPSGAMWKLHSVVFSVTASAVVLNRYPKLVVDNGSSVFFFSSSAQAITASQTWNICYSGFGSAIPNSTTFNLTQPLGAVEILMFQGYRFRTLFLGDPGDQLTAPIYNVEEWLVPG
jgi:hypothetical protein